MGYVCHTDSRVRWSKKTYHHERERGGGAFGEKVLFRGYCNIDQPHFILPQHPAPPSFPSPFTHTCIASPGTCCSLPHTQPIHINWPFLELTPGQDARIYQCTWLEPIPLSIFTHLPLIVCRATRSAWLSFKQSKEYPRLGDRSDERSGK